MNNISLDHKSLDELRTLFRGFIAKARTAVLNLDNAETAALAAELKAAQVVTYSLRAAPADLLASTPVQSPTGIAFQVKARDSSEAADVTLKVPGLHNVANALAALSVAKACGVSLSEAATHLGDFSGIRRRLEIVGTANEITIIDDFAHNPDKISATLKTLHAFPGRLLLMFQPHGYGPIRLMKDALVDCFVSGLRDEDVLIMPEPVYFGGTVDRSVGSREVISEIERRGRNAFAFPDRSACGDALGRTGPPWRSHCDYGRARRITFSIRATNLFDGLTRASFLDCRHQWHAFASFPYRAKEDDNRRRAIASRHPGRYRGKADIGPGRPKRRS